MGEFAILLSKIMTAPYVARGESIVRVAIMGAVLTAAGLVCPTAADCQAPDAIVQTSHLASEVWEHGMLLSEKYRPEVPWGSVPASDIARSCSCLGISDGTTTLGAGSDRAVSDGADTGKVLTQPRVEPARLEFKEQSVTLFMKVGMAMHSQNQSVTIQKTSGSYRLAWDCRIVRDIESDTAVVWVDVQNRLADGECTFDIACTIRSRKPFENDSEPHVLHDSDAIARIDRETPEVSLDEFGFHVLKQRLVCHVHSQRRDDLRQTSLRLVHPDAAKQSGSIAGNPPLKPNPFLETTIPVLFESSAVRKVTVNFGVVELGKSKNRSLENLSLCQDTLQELAKSLPSQFDFNLEQQTSADKTPKEIRFCPDATGRFSHIVAGHAEDGSPVEINLKGICYQPADE